MKKIVYICAIDWQHELGEVTDYTKIYSSIEDLKRQHTCWAGCGIAEIEISLINYVEPQNFNKEKK